MSSVIGAIGPPATNKDLLTLQRHTNRVSGVAYSPDGKHLATGSRDHTVKVWDAETGEELLSLDGHSRDVWGVAYSPDGKHIASASSDHTVRVWDVALAEHSLLSRSK
jgi:WD40 repeat protein